MGIDITHRISGDGCIFQRIQHGIRCAAAILRRRRDVMSIAAGTKTDQLAMDLCTPLFGVLIFFQYQYAGTIGQHKAITITIPGAARTLWVIVTSGKGSCCDKARHTQRRRTALTATGNHHIHITVLDHA